MNSRRHPSCWHRVHPWFVAAALCAHARHGHASPSARLVYVRGANTNDCPGEDVFRKAVAARLGYDPFFPSAEKSVVARIDKAPKGFNGHLQIVGQDGSLRGERELSVKGDNCAELVTSLALAVSIAIDDLDETPKASPPPDPPLNPPTSTPNPPDPTPNPPTSTPNPNPPDPTPNPPTSTPNPNPLRASVSVGPMASLGTSQGLALGLGLSGSLWVWGSKLSLGLRIDGHIDLPVAKRIPNAIQLDAAPPEITTQLSRGALSVCVRGTIPFICVGGFLGRLESKTLGIQSPRSDSGRVMGILVQGGAQVPLRTLLYLEPRLEMDVSPAPPSILLNDRPFLTFPILAGTASIHLGATFP